jgi:sugar phosphate isomerase/epimerase
MAIVSAPAAKPGEQRPIGAQEAVVFVACSTLCFARLPLERALRLISELEFAKLDVAIHEDGPHLKPSQVAKDVSAAAQQIRIGPSLTPAAFSVEISARAEPQFKSQLRAICRLARQSAVPILTLPAASSGSGVDAEVERLTDLVKLMEGEGISLAVLTRSGTLTENPATALELCQRVPGLGLTLDPSPYIAGPYGGQSYDELYPYVRHVHLRDTGRGPGQFQVRVGQGEVEYGRIVSQLQRFHYDRLLTVALHDIPEAPYAMDAEVRKLKYLLDSLI